MEHGPNTSESHEYGALNPHSSDFEARWASRPVKNVMITVDGDINEVAGRLSRSGVKVVDVLSEVGVVIGSIYDDTENDIRALKGVVAIDPNSEIELW